MGNSETKPADSPTHATSDGGSVGSAKSHHSGSTRSTHPSLHDQLMRTTNRDPMKYYDLLEVLGVGSMGTVAKVRKKTTAVGGSARVTFRESERKKCFGLPLTCCFGGEESSKQNIMDTSSNGSTQSSHPPASRSLLKKTSSIITYGTKKESYFALKSILLERAANETYIAELKNEVEILKALDHPCVVRPLETFTFRNQLYILMELCDGGDLYSRDPYTEREAARITSSILSAVAYLHSRNITHRDLKYENCMYASKHPQACVKLIDFGLSKKYGLDETMHDAVGTVYSMSPEVLRGEYTSKVDVWSVGVLAYMLCSSSMPFYGSSRKQVVKKILKGNFAFKARTWKYVSEEAKMFVKRCLTFDPKDRPTADEALKMAWMQKDFEALSPELDHMDMVQAALQNFAKYGTLKKLALMVIAHKSTSEEIGFLRKLFTKYDTLKNGVITLPEFKAALADYDYTDEEVEEMFAGIDVDGTDEVKYSEFLAATIEAHGAIDEERLAEAFDRIDCDDSGYITVANLATILGSDVPKSYLASIIDAADIKRDKKVSYEEFLALWSDIEDIKRKETLEDVKRRRVLHSNSIISAVSSSVSAVSALLSPDKEEVMSDLSCMSDEPITGGNLFQQEKAKSIRLFADV